MKVLGLDLTGVTGSLAVIDDEKILIEETVTSPDGFAHLLFDRLENLLSRAGLRLSEIDVYASSNGPGSFTGVRLSLAVAKGLAEAAGKPAFGVSNLRALASTGLGHLSVPVLDARRGDVYAALYGLDQEVVVPEFVAPFSRLLSLLENYDDWQFVTTDVPWLQSCLPHGYAENRGIPFKPAVAAAIAQCALKDMTDGVTGDPALLDANYVRRSDAEGYWQDR